MIKWILSFSAVTSLSGIMAFTDITGPFSVIAKVFFFLLAILFVLSIASAVINKQWK